MKSLGSIRRSFEPWNDPNQRPYIAFDNITKNFGDFTAVKDLTLHIYQREFLCPARRLGMRQVNALAHAGRLRESHQRPDPARRREPRRRSALQPPGQHDVPVLCAVPAYERGKEHRASGSSRTAWAKSEIDDRVNNMLKLVKLDQFGKRKPHQPLGRPAAARGARPPPSPSAPRCCCSTNRWAHSTRSCARKTQFELMDLQQDLGLTFVVVTHDQEEAMTMADRIAVMDLGRIVQIGTPAEIYEAPNSEFVASLSSATSICSAEKSQA